MLGSVCSRCWSPVTPWKCETMVSPNFNGPSRPLSYLSREIHISCYWSLALPFVGWHRGLDGSTPESVGFFEIHVHQKFPYTLPIIFSEDFKYFSTTCNMNVSPSDQLFSALQPLLFCIIFWFFLVFSESNGGSRVSEKVNTKIS
jgi:hypothetical protein